MEKGDWIFFVLISILIVACTRFFIVPRQFICKLSKIIYLINYIKIF